MTLLESRLKRPEAYRSGETVVLKCGVCQEILGETTIGELLLKKTAGTLSDAVAQSNYYLHMQKTGHADLISSHELVIVHNFAMLKGMVGIKLHYP